jgi:hypothetical protein
MWVLRVPLDRLALKGRWVHKATKDFRVLLALRVRREIRVHLVLKVFRGRLEQQDHKEHRELRGRMAM